VKKNSVLKAIVLLLEK